MFLYLLCPPAQNPDHQWPRNGPARQKLEVDNVNRIASSCFDACIVTVEPTKKKSIKDEKNNPIKRWIMRFIM